MAVRKRKDVDLIVGNLIGSNIFNVAFVLTSLGLYTFPMEKIYLHDGLTLLIGALFLLCSYLVGKIFGKPSARVFLMIYGITVWRWLAHASS